jgi:hypothetical protein
MSLFALLGILELIVFKRKFKFRDKSDPVVRQGPKALKIRRRARKSDCRVTGRGRGISLNEDKMTKFKMLMVFAAALMVIPFSASAMDVITDREMEGVTGQSGVSISVSDIHLDLSILNEAWGDNDCGTMILSTMRHGYSQGYWNLFDWKFENVYIDMDVLGTSGYCTDEAGGSYLAYAAHPITIDVMTFSSNGPHCPAQTLRGKTAVVIGVPDLYVAIEEMPMPPIFFLPFTYLQGYLDDKAYNSETTQYNSTQKWEYTNTQPDDSKLLGKFVVSGVQITTHAYVGGYETVNTVPGGRLAPINPNHRGLIYAH